MFVGMIENGKSSVAKWLNHYPALSLPCGDETTVPVCEGGVWGVCGSGTCEAETEGCKTGVCGLDLRTFGSIKSGVFGVGFSEMGLFGTGA